MLSTHLLGNALNGSEIARAGKGKTRFDHINAKPRQLLGNGQLFLQVEAGSWGLFTIPKGGVEDQNAAWIMGHGNSLDAI